MKIIKTEDFGEQLNLLPARVQKLFARQEEIFLLNIRDSRLHLKKLVTKEEIFSFRITRQYRCLFYFYQENVVVFFAIGHRKDIYD